MKKLIFSSLIAVLLLSFCQNKAAAQVEDNTVYNFVSMENPPSYPGGMASFYKFLGENIKYPQQAKDDNIQGTVYISFMVEKDGSLNDLKVDRKLGGGTDEEAIRVLRLSKRWNPGMQNGKVVRVKYNIPVKFSIPSKKPNPKADSPVADRVGPVKEGKVYDLLSIENPPLYPGGIAKFYEFITENIKYPKSAIDAKVEGNVYVSFTIAEDGYLTDIKVNSKLGAGLDEEAIRVIKLSKRWMPGMHNGKPVRVKYNVPIKFKLPK
ncbi:energy transducer TonB [Pedobacter boryungensis]|uniref:Energy transducer TonB n=1 Tax=Pedobacter boryungensis TaxID=869962 RepID=A0ABX2DCL3_9SPHI|nr:energy transducer TonB [Pedobacter boryungensis]NQX31828.1 energy transducer TonB [Pedobacter boryungensis]